MGFFGTIFSASAIQIKCVLVLSHKNRAMYLNCQHIPLISFRFFFIFSLLRAFVSFIQSVCFFPLLLTSQWLRSNYNLFFFFHFPMLSFHVWESHLRGETCKTTHDNTENDTHTHTNVYFPHERFFAMGFFCACLKMSLTLVARFAVVFFLYLFYVGC